jgi:hypothetical protein
MSVAKAYTLRLESNAARQKLEEHIEQIPVLVQLSSGELNNTKMI